MTEDYNRATVERRVRHQYSIEILYHFRCCVCDKWWTIGDWTPVDALSCPHCSQVGEIDGIDPNAELS